MPVLAQLNEGQALRGRNKRRGRRKGRPLRGDSIDCVELETQPEGHQHRAAAVEARTPRRVVQVARRLAEARALDVAGRTAERVERLGDFYASPGMLSESFTLVRAHGVRKIGEGGGTESEDINVHLVPRAEIANFIEQKRAEGFGVDVKLLLFLNF